MDPDGLVSFLILFGGGFAQVLAAGQVIQARRRDLAHAVLPVLSIVAVSPFAARPIDLYASMGIARFRSYSPREAMLSATLYSATLLSFGYMIALLSKIVRLRRDASRQPRRLIDITASMIGLILLLNLWWLLDRALSLGTLPYLYTAFTGFLVAIYLISIRYPEYLLVMRREAERVRYARTRIKGIDVDDTLVRLDAILGKGEAYRDEDISLGQLADRLGLTPHQLSEVINARLGKSFFELIDGYRLEEVKRTLLDDPSRRVIDVALDAGFNSPSAFYRAFKKDVGMSPSEFRKPH